MSLSLFLFLSFIFSLLVLYFCCRDFLSTKLADRRKQIVIETVSLKKDLKFSQLERKRSYEFYLVEQSKYENWKSEAESLYTACYEDQKSMYDSFFEEEKQKKDFIYAAKMYQEQVMVLTNTIQLLKERLKKECIDLNFNFVEMIETL